MSRLVVAAMVAAVVGIVVVSPLVGVRAAGAQDEPSPSVLDTATFGDCASIFGAVGFASTNGIDPGSLLSPEGAALYAAINATPADAALTACGLGAVQGQVGGALVAIREADQTRHEALLAAVEGMAGGGSESSPALPEGATIQECFHAGQEAETSAPHDGVECATAWSSGRATSLEAQAQLERDDVYRKPFLIAAGLVVFLLAARVVGAWGGR